ncbi:hypothetical protein TNCT_235101 [Trichonephila clavata]|uniref:Uncharacterized protein n=1 Tax=Trichonephila clavata TaxID=2740835 RepID=A0A8X6HZD4_TRICU|nr:hypothetical protein TNCT_235101 [Trichonephila clavata]
MPKNSNNANLEIFPSNPFYEWVSCNEYSHFNTISLNSAPNTCTNKDVKENKMFNNPTNANWEILLSNPCHERISYNEDYHFNPTPSNYSPDNHTDEDMQENSADSFGKKNVFRKVKFFFKRNCEPIMQWFYIQKILIVVHVTYCTHNRTHIPSKI